MLDRPYPAIDIIAFFKTRSALVVAAVASLDALPTELAALKVLVGARDLSRLERHLETLQRIVQGATIGSDNLLIATRAAAREPFVMCLVNRLPSGAVDVRTIELDRDALALSGAVAGKAPRPLDTLAIALETFASDDRPQTVDDAFAALDALSAQVRASVSRLSIVKARLDLQQSFLSSVMEADAGAPLVQLDSHLNEAGARDMALEARRLLSTGSRTIASGNRKTLTSLFESLSAETLVGEQLPERV